jgi:hypothetical protein
MAGWLILAGSAALLRLELERPLFRKIVYVAYVLLALAWTACVLGVTTA